MTQLVWYKILITHYFVCLMAECDPVTYEKVTYIKQMEHMHRRRIWSNHEERYLRAHKSSRMTCSNWCQTGPQDK